MDVPRLRLSPTPERRLLEALHSNHLVTGPHLDAFERRVAESLHFPHCLATANGFSAIHLALIVAGLSKRRVVLPCASTCFSVYQAARAAGCQVVFCDLDRYCQLDPRSVASANKRGAIDGVLSPLHFGISTPIELFRELSVPVVEDGAQGFFTLREQPSSADVTALSFYPSKFISAIDGGALLSRNRDWIEQARDRSYYDNQTTSDGVQRYNYRMSNVHAAVGLDSLDLVAGFASRIRDVNERYRSAFSEFGALRVIRDPANHGLESRFVVELPTQETAEYFLAGMIEAGVTCGRELMMLAKPDAAQDFPVATGLVSRVVSLPLFPDIRDAEVDRVVGVAVDVMRRMGV